MSSPSHPPHILPHVLAARAYTPGEQPAEPGWIKLNTNENPYPPAPGVAPAIAAALERLPLYPHPSALPLRRKIAEIHNLPDPSWVLAGNGSDDVLNILVRSTAGPGRPVAALDPSYSLYPVLAALQQAPFLPIPFPADFSLPLSALASSGAALLFLTSPNAPLGLGFPNAAISRLAASFPGLLVIDEAYAAFAPENAVPLLADHPNLVITRTFSKSHGLAGLRVGYLLAHPTLTAQFEKVRDSYNLDALAQAGALAALQDPAYYADITARLLAARDDLSAFLSRRLGWFTFPSAANFLCTRPARHGLSGPEVAAACLRHLRDRRILVRHFPSHPRVADFLRLSLGTPDQLRALTAALADFAAL